ncbi:S-layer family protein [Leptolyngbya sp. NK1-12]|uniref:S-layer family protein n=2 Tax=unclassified Leptolyngbya TaxID=2650499 RepID=A0AA96WFD4_9CYAN|nr:S-layer family protein [Leptolyngbya sp. NK1-12]WNZ24214.1 S-layer family protein [Leptolyngbya sp. NK1-12]
MKQFSLLGGLVGSVMIGAGWVSPTVAEIVPDSTLSQPSRVTRSGNRTVITEGTRRGSNLFHSFREFSVAPGEAASFQGIDASITNIFTRVTGRNLSRINGLVEVLQPNNRISPANLFLLNPNGIIFGKNASLQVGGSFIATTADSINFADGTQFSAVRPQTNPLLTVSVPVGLQFGPNPGGIVNRSIAPQTDAAGNPLEDSFGFPVAGLIVDPDQTFALVGGDVTLTGRSSIRTNGGRIEIGSVAGRGQVSLTPISQGWDLRYEAVDQFGDVRLLDIIQLNASGAPGGTIQIQGERVILRQSLVFSASDNSTQPSGALEIRATGLIVIGQDSFLSTSTRGDGRAGNIILLTQQLRIRAGGQVGSTTSGRGKGGNVRVNASEAVTVAGISPTVPFDSPLSLLYANSQGASASGNLSIETNRLQVRSGGQIGISAFGRGRAGNLTIRANTIELIGTPVDANGRPLLDEGLPISGGLFVGTDIGSSGNGGTLRIQTQRLRIRDGAILQATTYGSGRAGNIDVRASEAIEVSGVSEQGGFPARIAATSGGVREFSTPQSRRATGSGGNLRLSTANLTVRDQGLITVSSLNPESPGAGSIRIGANRMLLDNQGRLRAQTESGSRARIELDDVDLLVLRRGSEISTTAGLRSGRGDGGNININANFILNAPAENSDIDADASRDNGGNININAQGILGVTARDQRTDQSDITATSDTGVDGEISINTPTVDPTRGIVELPSTLVDASQLIAQGCRAGGPVADRLGEFVVTGRGGLPPNPTDLRGSGAVITDWAIAPQSSGSAINQEPAISRATATAATSPVIEAQGWVRDKDGKVMLVADAATATPDATWTSLNCLGQIP